MKLRELRRGESEVSRPERTANDALLGGELGEGILAQPRTRAVTYVEFMIQMFISSADA